MIYFAESSVHESKLDITVSSKTTYLVDDPSYLLRYSAAPKKQEEPDNGGSSSAQDQQIQSPPESTESRYFYFSYNLEKRKTSRHTSNKTQYEKLCTILHIALHFSQPKGLRCPKPLPAHWGRRKRVCVSVVGAICLVGLIVFVSLFPASFIYVEYDQVFK